MTEKKIPRSNVSAYVKKYIQLCIGAVIVAIYPELNPALGVNFIVQDWRVIYNCREVINFD